MSVCRCAELAASSESLLLLAAAAEPVAPLLRLLTQVTPLEDGGEEVHPLHQTGVWLLHCLQALQLLAALQAAGRDPAKQVSRPLSPALLPTRSRSSGR